MSSKRKSKEKSKGKNGSQTDDFGLKELLANNAFDFSADDAMNEEMLAASMGMGMAMLLGMSGNKMPDLGAGKNPLAGMLDSMQDFMASDVQKEIETLRTKTLETFTGPAEERKKVEELFAIMKANCTKKMLKKHHQALMSAIMDGMPLLDNLSMLLSTAQREQLIEIMERDKKRKEEKQNAPATETEDTDEKELEGLKQLKVNARAAVAHTNEYLLKQIYTLLEQQKAKTLQTFQESDAERKQVIGHFAALKTAMTQESLQQHRGNYAAIAQEGILGASVQQLFPEQVNGINQIVTEYLRKKAREAEEKAKREREEARKAQQKQKEKEREKRKRYELKFSTFAKEALELALEYPEQEAAKFGQLMLNNRDCKHELHFLNAFFQHVQSYSKALEAHYHQAPVEKRAALILIVFDRFLDYTKNFPDQKKPKEIPLYELEIIRLKATHLETTFHALVVASQQAEMLEQYAPLVAQYYKAASQVLQQFPKTTPEEATAIQARLLQIQFAFAKVQIAENKVSEAMQLIQSILRPLNTKGAVLSEALIRLKSECALQEKALQARIDTIKANERKQREEEKKRRAEAAEKERLKQEEAKRAAEEEERKAREETEANQKLEEKRKADEKARAQRAKEDARQKAEKQKALDAKASAALAKAATTGEQWSAHRKKADAKTIQQAEAERKRQEEIESSARGTALQRQAEAANARLLQLQREFESELTQQQKNADARRPLLETTFKTALSQAQGAALETALQRQQQDIDARQKTLEETHQNELKNFQDSATKRKQGLEAQQKTELQGAKGEKLVAELQSRHKTEKAKLLALEEAHKATLLSRQKAEKEALGKLEEVHKAELKRRKDEADRKRREEEAEAKRQKEERARLEREEKERKANDEAEKQKAKLLLQKNANGLSASLPQSRSTSPSMLAAFQAKQAHATTMQMEADAQLKIKCQQTLQEGLRLFAQGNAFRRAHSTLLGATQLAEQMPPSSLRMECYLELIKYFVSAAGFKLQNGNIPVCREMFDDAITNRDKALKLLETPESNNISSEEAKQFHEVLATYKDLEKRKPALASAAKQLSAAM